MLDRSPFSLLHRRRWEPYCDGRRSTSTGKQCESTSRQPGGIGPRERLKHTETVGFIGLPNGAQGRN
jgi:hypothetical protein